MLSRICNCNSRCTSRNITTRIVTVSVTVLSPISSQSKLLGLIAKVKALSAVQLSVDPLLISAAVILAAPEASS